MSNERHTRSCRRVVWKEGTFLRPQHFQQQDRYFEALVEGRAGGLRPYAWGLFELHFDRALLAQGKLRVTACRGVFEDGTPFAIPARDEEPPILDVPPQTRNALVYLTLPAQRDAAAAFTADEDPRTPVRYLAGEQEVSDVTAEVDRTARILTARSRLRLHLTGDDLGPYTTLPLARIIEVRADRTVTLDEGPEGFIPPCLDCRATARLHGFIQEVHGLLQHRAQALAGRLGGGGTGELGDLLLLQVVNQFEPLFGHLAQIAGLHPEELFRHAVQLTGALAVHLSKDRRPASLRPYRHHDLRDCYQDLMTTLRGYLSTVLERNVLAIPLKDVGGGVRCGILTDRTLLDSAVFVLAAKADIPGESLRQGLPANIKIGPVERIPDLVNRHLRGIPLRPLAVAPRQLPFHQGFAYFELDKANDIWFTLRTSGGIGFFTGSGFPGLELELWAIRSG